MRTADIAKALQSAGFSKESHDKGIDLVPCSGCSRVDWVWVNGQQVAQPSGAHSHYRSVRPRSHQAGFKLYQRNDGAIVVLGIDPVEVSSKLRDLGFLVELVERYGWRAYSEQVRYAAAVVIGKQEGR